MHILLSFILTLCLFYIPPLYSQQISAESQVADYLKQGSEHQRQGFYLDAKNAYQNAYQIALHATDRKTLALTQTTLAYSEYLLNRPDNALPLLQAALNFAKQTQDPGLLAITQYYLGLIHHSTNQRTQANAFLQQSLTQANIFSDPLLMSRIHIALAENAPQQEKLFEHQQLALHWLKKVTQTNITGELFLLLVEQGLENPLFPELFTTTKANQTKANQHLAYLYQLLQQAKPNLDIKNARQQGKYYALKARLYESQQRYPEALRLTLQAIQQLKTEKAADVLMFYEWQAGRLYKTLNKNQLAIDSYRRAISHVQAVRQDIPIRYANGKSSFLELFGPLYRGMIELLLQQAKNTPSHSNQTPHLSEVQIILERLKQNELEDFFKDRCLLTDIDTNRLKINEEKVAVLYPIVLPEQIELLLNIGEHFYHHTIPVSAEIFEATVRHYATQLREGTEKKTNRQLYDWLIRPLDQHLTKHQVETLVYIPDGVLRLLSIASLHDGQQYLIENYAISTLPGLAILPIDQQIEPSNLTLLAGLSEPNAASVNQFPENLLRGLLDKPATITSFEISPIPQTSRSVSNKLLALNVQTTLLTRQLELERIAQALLLPGVKEEIELLSKTLPSKILLNENYTLDRFSELAVQAEYSTIHIASHGFIGGSSEESFIMTYDQLLSINQLEDLLNKRDRKNPIDLLVLSACQTAEGDDRAPLGLSGIALKAKAKTALGSLWPISDKAAVQIMNEFYVGLKQRGLSKAKALQQAQIKLIQNDRLRNPFYWAPFVLVGHWR